MDDIAILLTGGIHQSLHLLPLAAPLAAAGHRVSVFALSEPTRAFCDHYIANGETPGVTVSLLEPGPVERLLLRFTSKPVLKAVRLVERAGALRGFAAILAAERTSTLLKRWHLLKTPLIHIPHGAGDRRVSYDPRSRLFDFHIVSGPKDKRRFIEERLGTPENIVESGSIKLAALARRPIAAPPLFAAHRPIVLYNPHFEPKLGSWQRIGIELLELFSKDNRFNFILAPHIRLREQLKPAAVARIEAYASPHLHIDLGSERSCDMTYTRMADIYLGDVSSQIYEFLATPKPCVFLNAVNARYEDDPDFRMWALGEVAATAPQAMAAIARGRARHPEFADRQKLYFADAMGSDWRNAPQIAADAVLAFLRRSRQPA